MRNTPPAITARTTYANDKNPDRPLTVGFVSPDFGRHPVGTMTVRLFENLNRDEVRAVIFSTRPEAREDAISARIRAVTDWRRVKGWDDDRLAEAIGTAKIDILFDMSGHTAGHRLKLFARKPAPIAVTWFGYVGTTGVPAIDYVLADPIEAPPGTEAHYAERDHTAAEVLRLFRSAGLCAAGCATAGAGQRLYHLWLLQQSGQTQRRGDCVLRPHPCARSRQPLDSQVPRP